MNLFKIPRSRWSKIFAPFRLNSSVSNVQPIRYQQSFSNTITLNFFALTGILILVSLTSSFAAAGQKECSTVLKGSEFLRWVYPELQDSRAVDRAAQRSDLYEDEPRSLTPDERLKVWAEFSQARIDRYNDNSRAIDRLKKFVLFHLVFDQNDREMYAMWTQLANSNSQKSSRFLSPSESMLEIERARRQLSMIDGVWLPLEGWIDYLVSKEADQYPFWLKYWSLIEVLKLTNTIDASTQLFRPQVSGSIEPYVEFDREAFQKMASSLIEKLPQILEIAKDKNRLKQLGLESSLDLMSFNRWYRGQTEALFPSAHAPVQKSLGVNVLKSATPPAEISSEIKLLGEWVQKNRKARGWSLEVLARKLDRIGHPVSTNKIWRIENTDKRPLKKIDAKLLLKLEELFVEKFKFVESELSFEDEVLALINKWPKKPKDPKLMVIYEALNRKMESRKSK